MCSDLKTKILSIIFPVIYFNSLVAVVPALKWTLQGRGRSVISSLVIKSMNFSYFAFG